ncbi:MAG: hypothetical protein AB8B71_00090 [Paracoccaceae bacterium]
MQSRIAIVGSGVTAGLAAHMLGSKGHVSLFQNKQASASPIPEIVPRRLFFDTLGVSCAQEEAIVEAAKTPIKIARWATSQGVFSKQMATTSQYFVYDKGRLAKQLLASAKIARHPSAAVETITDVQDFSAVVDCRGTVALANDVTYHTTTIAPAQTKCVYVIAQQPDDWPTDTMMFWDDGPLRTYFSVPVGDSTVSFGCSHAPQLVVQQDELLTMAARFGLAIDPDSVIFSGTADPARTVSKPISNLVTPIGEAATRSCPLSEYGTLRAMSQIKVFMGEPGLEGTAFDRPKHSEVDPHIPLELFL